MTLTKNRENPYSRLLKEKEGYITYSILNYLKISDILPANINDKPHEKSCLSLKKASYSFLPDTPFSSPALTLFTSHQL